MILTSTLLLALAATPPAPLSAEVIEATVQELVATHGDAESARARRGVTQVARRWWTDDGDAAAFSRFCEEHYLTEEAQLAAAFRRMQEVMEQVDGHLHEIRRLVTTPLDLDTGPVPPLDHRLAGLDLASHVNDDLFGTRAAFVVLLNFPLRTLEEILAQGPEWDRETWARTRMADRFALRVPPAVLQQQTAAFTAADQYIADYNIRMDRLVNADGERLFPEGLRLITHWGLRDELASHYGQPDGIERQRMIAKVMERIVRQEIPAAVIDNGELLWNPFTNEVRAYPGAADAPAAGDVPGEAAGAADAIANTREPDTRYQKLLDVFHAVRAEDPYSPLAPTYIERRFERDRQMPEAEVEALLESVVGSAEVEQLARSIERRLGRPLEPFDIWYSGNKARGSHSEAELDAITKQRYPTVASFQQDLPRILRDLGFSTERASWLAEHIVVDPARGAGHAMGAQRREDQAHLRTRVGADGMDYKGYNIAIHELGHNVEQVFSLNAIDHWWLNGVPNTAFTEALAFVFQNRDLELLGIDAGDRQREAALATLWATYEIGGVALVDMRVWRWLYDHPQATAAELREATLAIAREVWNRWYAPVFGVRDAELLAIYSHMIVYGLYLPDYPIGHIIAFQVAQAIGGKEHFGERFEAIARQGRLTPEAWMRGAVGEPVSAAALLASARTAIAAAE